MPHGSRKISLMAEKQTARSVKGGRAHLVLHIQKRFVAVDEGVSHKECLALIGKAGVVV